MRNSCGSLWPGIRPHHWVIEQQIALSSQCSARKVQNLSLCLGFGPSGQNSASSNNYLHPLLTQSAKTTGRPPSTSSTERFRLKHQQNGRFSHLLNKPHSRYPASVSIVRLFSNEATLDVMRRKSCEEFVLSKTHWGFANPFVRWRLLAARMTPA